MASEPQHQPPLRRYHGRVVVEKADSHSLAAGIQLNDRQKKLYASGKPGLGKRMQEQKKQQLEEEAAERHQYLGQEPTQTAETVPNTFSEDSMSVTSSYGTSSTTSSYCYASSSLSSRNKANAAANSFYGQRLPPQERKMYDDQGNTWRDSQSEAASSSATALSRASSTTSKASKSSSVSVTSMERLRQLNLQRKTNERKPSSASSSSVVGSTYSSTSKNSFHSSSRSTSTLSAAAESSAKSKTSNPSPRSFASKAPSSSLQRKPSVVVEEEEDDNDDELLIPKVETATISASSSRTGRLEIEIAPGDYTAQPKSSDNNTLHKASGLATQKEKSKFLRKTMMQWAKPASTTTSTTLKKSTPSSAGNGQSSAPSKPIISTTDCYRSPKSIALASGSISPKEMSIMRKVAERNKSKAKSPTRRVAAGKVIKSTSSRMKNLLTSSSSSSLHTTTTTSSSSFFKEEESKKIVVEETTLVETTATSSTLYDDSGNIVNENALSSVYDDDDDEDAPMDEAQADRITTPKNATQVDQVRKPIVTNDDMGGMTRIQGMRQKSKRGRSSIFKRRIGNIGKDIVDDLMEEIEELSSDDENEMEYEEDYSEPSKNIGEDVSESGYVTAPSLHRAKSIKSIKSGTTPRTIGETPRTIDNILDASNEFLNTMRDGPLKQGKDMDMPILLDNDPTMSEDYGDDETEEYRTFTTTLKTELLGTHSNLYDSFHAMFRNANNQDRRARPLAAAVYPGSLDLKTKETVASISKYLNTEHDVECLLGSQIVKDADVKDLEFQHSMMKTSKVGDHHDQDDDYGVMLARQVSPRMTNKQHNITDTGDKKTKTTNKQHGNTNASTTVFKSHQANGTGPTNLNEVKLKKTRTIPAKIDTETEAVPSSWTKVKLRKVTTPTNNNTGTTKSKERKDTTSEHKPAEFHRIVLRKTPTNNANANGIKKKKNTRESFERNLKTAPSSITDISGCSKKPIDIAQAGTGSDHPIKLTTPAAGVTRTGREDNPINLAPSVGYEENPIQLVPSRGEESCNPIQIAPSIDLDLLTGGGSIIIALAEENGARDDDDIAMSVIVEMDGITKVQSTTWGQESAKANVIWKLERSEVKSVLLDMSSCTVKVVVSSDSDKTNKDLLFPSSAQCMHFANALHEMVNNNNTISSVVNNNDDNNDEEQVWKKKHSTAASAVPDFAKVLPSKKVGGPMPMSAVNGGSPVSKVSGTSKPAQKYELMLRMKVPKEDVKSKMEQDGVDPSIIASVLGEEEASTSPAPLGTSLTADEAKEGAKYRKMLKMGIPPEAVAHKMKKDGIDQTIIHSVLGGTADLAAEPKAAAPSAAPHSSLTLPEQAAAQKYQKMLKMCIPKEAVEHKMNKDGVDAKIIAFVLGISPGAAPPDASGSKQNTVSSALALTPDEEKMTSTYKRMLKMSIPKEAVRHKMMKDGISEKIVAVVLGDDKKKSLVKSAAPKPKNFNKAGFRWNVIDDDVSIAGSVWSKAKSEQESAVAAQDILKHVEEFQKKAETKVALKKKTGSGQGKKDMAKLIELNRAQNVAITLKAFNDCSYKQLAQIIEFLDPAGKINGDRTFFMKDLLPTLNEVKAIKSYTGGDEFLLPAERWFREVIHIKRIEEKVEVIRTMQTFKMDAIILGKSFKLLTNVCNQIMNSDRLPDLLDMVRQIGNRMNQGGDAAAGFKLDFLPKLTQTKGSDKNTTALDLVILIFCTRNQRDALRISDDFPEIQEASRMQFSDLTADTKNLIASFRKCKREFESLEKEHELSLERKAPKSTLKVSADSRIDLGGSSQNASLSLLDAIKSHNRSPREGPSVAEARSAIHKSNEQVRKSLSPRSSLLVSLSGKSDGEMQCSIEASIRRLEKFLSEANHFILPQLESDRTAAIQACTDLASFFCEKGGERVASNLLKILAEFASNIDRSLKKYDEQQKILARKEAAFKKKKNGSSTKSLVSKVRKKVLLSRSKPSAESPVKTNPRVPVEVEQKKSIVLMVNEMLKVAGDKEIDDFVSGKVLDNPDTRLKQIYEAEQARKANGDRGDILTAIKKRRSMSINPGADQALSDLRANLSEETRDELDLKRRKSQVANRWSSRRDLPSKSHLGNMVSGTDAKDFDETSDISSPLPNPRNSRIVSRWSSKPIKKTDSEVLSSISEDTHDIALSQKRRQSVANRWSSKGPVEKASSGDTDISAFQDMVNQRRTRALNRWSSRQK